MLQLNLKMIEKTASKILLFNQKVTLCCISQKLANPQKEISYFLTKMITHRMRKNYFTYKNNFPHYRVSFVQHYSRVQNREINNFFTCVLIMRCGKKSIKSNE